ncbi:MAG: sugar transferase [Acidobacteriales bacterium]|nr:sugar transferase [Terriglobales bacterium]
MSTQVQSGELRGAGDSFTENVSPWLNSPAKRAFDVFSSILILLAVLPILFLCAVAIKLDSAGPALFRQTRVGKDGKTFEIIKLRTMVHQGDKGPSLTRTGDKRITAIGRILRLLKVDEAPQLWNVIRGDMSMVGPRPDLPEYISALRSDRMSVLALRPGLTSPASLKFRNEEDTLSQVPADELRAFYTNVVLPEKIRIDLEYAEHATLFSDLQVIVSTALIPLRLA